MDVVSQSTRVKYKDFPLSPTDTRDWRPLIFLAVLIIHIVIVLLVIRAAQLQRSPSTPINDPWVLLLLPHKARATADVAAPPRRAGQSQVATSKDRATKP